MNYFGVLTCPNCGQKVSLEPNDVIVEASAYQYMCKRCKHIDALPEDFLFKQPVGKDLSVSEAVKMKKGGRGKMKLPGWLGKIFTRDP